MKKSTPSQKYLHPVGYESQWINAPASCSLEEFWGAFYKVLQSPPIAHYSNQLNKVSLLWERGQKDNFIGFSFFPISSSEFLAVLSEIIFSKLPAPWLVLRLCHWSYLTKALFQPEKWCLFVVVPVNMIPLYFRLMWSKRYRNFLNIAWTLGYFPTQ